MMHVRAAMVGAGSVLVIYTLATLIFLPSSATALILNSTSRVSPSWTIYALFLLQIHILHPARHNLFLVSGWVDRVAANTASQPIARVRFPCIARPCPHNYTKDLLSTYQRSHRPRSTRCMSVFIVNVG